MKERTGKDADGSWLEQFMKLAFSGKIKFNRDAMDAPRTRTFKNVNEYIAFLKAESVYYQTTEIISPTSRKHAFGLCEH
jgi:hypothetical protein